MAKCKYYYFYDTYRENTFCVQSVVVYLSITAVPLLYHSLTFVVFSRNTRAKGNVYLSAVKTYYEKLMSASTAR